MKNKSDSTAKKSPAVEKLGGQPENDQDAREAGAKSATAPQEPKKPAGKGQ